MFKIATKRVDVVVNHCSIDENFETWRHFADIKNKNLKYNGKSVLKILLKLLVIVLLKGIAQLA